ncbi:MAG: hypothetical protein JNJ83_01945 [Verrucomicrobiaceae bacterium]|nr:hypothetical protein [Verrucomicrobiaceae bacterium]
MTSSEIITAISIHLLVPVAGVVAYLALCRRLFVAGASPMFLAQLFLLFVCYGGVLLVVLTSLFWYWSGMASLGVFFLILAAPILLLPVLLSLWKQKNHSLAHRIAFRACGGYYVLIAVLLCSLPLMRSMVSSHTPESSNKPNNKGRIAARG